MATMSHEPPRVRERPGWTIHLSNPEMWGSLAIIAMWLSVLFTAVWGPEVVSSTATTNAVIPSAVFVAPFAFFGTWVVARHAFRREPHE